MNAHQLPKLRGMDFWSWQAHITNKRTCYLQGGKVVLELKKEEYASTILVFLSSRGVK